MGIVWASLILISWGGAEEHRPTADPVIEAQTR
jgi:hypothetical protein